MDSLVRVPCRNREPLDLLRMVREAAERAKKLGLCVVFLPINRSEENWIDCYLFDVQCDTVDTKSFFVRHLGEEDVQLHDSPQTIDWKLARLAGAVSEELYHVQLGNDQTSLISYCVYHLVTSLGESRHLNSTFFGRYIPLTDNHALNSATNNVRAFLFGEYPEDEDKRYRLYQDPFLHYVMNSLGINKHDENRYYDQWFQ